MILYKKIGKATTDSEGPYISYDETNRPGLSNLIRIYSEFSDLSIDEIVKQYENENTAFFKESLSNVLNTKLEPIRNETLKLRKDKTYLKELMQKGSNEAIEIAEKTMRKVRN